MVIIICKSLYPGMQTTTAQEYENTKYMLQVTCYMLQVRQLPWYEHLKGILHQKIFYRLNLIFWIVMGCGIADFDRRGL